VRTFEALPWLLKVTENPDVRTSPSEAAVLLREDLAALDLS
jgi:hypothetical protein